MWEWRFWLGLSVWAAIVFLTTIAWRIRARAGKRVARDRPHQRYSAFTTAHDVIATGRDVPDLLHKRDKHPALPKGTRVPDHFERIEQATLAYEAALAGDCDALRDWLRGRAETTAVTLLIDQSGSVRDDIVPLAGQILAAAELFDRAGVELSVLGFTTVGWKGGAARLAWIDAGRKRYPGRLCAVLHVVYKDFNRPIDREDWRSLLDAQALRENVDGEALLWAIDMFENSSKPNKRLILLSDAAPVDDSTMMENGTKFLPRHLREVVDDIEKTGCIRLGQLKLSAKYSSPVRWKINVANEASFVTDLAKLLVLMD